jgi:uncharacterized protein DUF6089
MKRLSILPFLFATQLLLAQYYEAGGYIGASNYLGDLSEQRLIPEESGLLTGIYGKYNFSRYLSVKASLTKGQIGGTDKNARQSANRQRNLNFRSDILELATTVELNLSPYNIRDNKTGIPYIFAGFALTNFNPQAQMRGTWYYLHPLQTEGKNYGRTTVALPFGLGMKFNLTYKVNFGFEVGARKTFSDYLDDVSSYYPDIYSLRSYAPATAALSFRTPELTGEFGENPVGSNRGDTGNKDWYFFAGINFSVNLTDKYGIDFDPEYEIFKEHLKKEKKDRKKSLNKRYKKAKYQKKLRLKKKKTGLQPVVKKRTK